VTQGEAKTQCVSVVQRGADPHLSTPS
jgi:hypothetical protein